MIDVVELLRPALSVGLGRRRTATPAMHSGPIVLDDSNVVVEPA